MGYWKFKNVSPSIRNGMYVLTPESRALIMAVRSGPGGQKSSPDGIDSSPAGLDPAAVFGTPTCIRQ